MLKALIPNNESQRIENLRLYGILDSAPEPEFDDIARLASQICKTPISLISLIDTDRQWFKSHVGFEARQAERDSAFCGHTILGDDLFVVPDALQDVRFADNPFVKGDPYLRFYCGTPLVSDQGFALGTLCVIDRVPRQLSGDQIHALKILGRQVVALLNLRMAISISRAGEAKINQVANRLSLAAQSAKIGVWDWELETNVITWDATMFELYGISPTEDFRLDYSVWSSALESEILAEQETILRATIARNGRSEREFKIRRRDGATRVIRAAESVVLDEHHKPLRVVGVNRDVTESHQAEERIRHMSLHDALTGLPNRLLFTDRVEQALRRSKRDTKWNFAVMFIDLDRFKVVNDSLGHVAGDVLLKTIGARLQSCLRSTDSLSRNRHVDSIAHSAARMGGDEFTLLLEGLKKPSDAALVALRVLATVAKPITFDGQEFMTTASIGIVSGVPKYNSADELLRDADSAMYRAKTTGKARYVMFDSTMHAAAVSRMQLENDLRRAIERGELLLHYQPILSIQTQELMGFEALIRWGRVSEDGTRKLISPADFIPIAEDTRLIVPIGEWVLEEACRQMATWKQKYSAAAHLTISVNVSGKQLIDDRFVAQLRKVLLLTKLNPKSIRLEITESVLLDDQHFITKRLEMFKSTGVLLAIDDFGTGYSSLSCLHRFPIDILKIDRSFVQNIEGSKSGKAIIQAVVHLAHGIGMNVVAEGIEKCEQLAFLQSLGCSLGQGYLFSKPVTAQAAEQFFAPYTPLAVAS